MKLEFYINPDIPFETINDSMQLDSGTCLAHLKIDGMEISLEVRGQVRVVWNPEPDGTTDGGSVYTCASQFPDDLMRVFAERMNTADMTNIFIDDNNWFEVFIEKNGKFQDSFTVDPENMLPDTMFSILWDAYTDFQKKEDVRKKTLADAILFFQGKKEELKKHLQTKEEAGVYPHDVITTHTIDYEDGQHSLFVEIKLYSDRDGGEDDPDIYIVVDGFNAVRESTELNDLINEILEI